MRNGQRKLEMMRDPRVSGMGRFKMLKLMRWESQFVKKGLWMKRRSRDVLHGVDDIEAG